MRTKTLLLTAVLGVAGIASSSAQVFSVNAVGYVNLTVPPGLSMIANPLNNTSGNTIATVLTVPAGTQIYKFNGSGFTSALYDDIDGWTSSGSPAGNITLNPGEGTFIRNNGAQFTITFVGDVMQGSLSVPLPAGLSIAASQVPQQGKVSTDLGFPLIAGTQIYTFNGTAYTSFLYDDIDGWTQNGSPSEPNIAVGQSFWVRNNGTAANWTRTFSVN
jgi:hypothetical protein